MIAVVIRRARADVPLLVVSAAVLLVTALGVAMPVQRIVRMSTAGLVDALEGAAAPERGLTVHRQVSTDSLTVADLQTEGRQIHDALPPPVRAVTGTPATIVDSPRMEAVDPVLPGRRRRVTLRAQPGYRAHVRVVEGRLPRATTDRLRTPRGLRDRFLQRQSDMAVTEVAVSPPTARALRVAPGDVVILNGDVEDPYVGRAPGSPPFVALRVVGLVAPDDVARPVWFGDRAVHTPTEISDPGGASVTVFATAFMAPDALDTLAVAITPLPLVPTWRFPVAPGRVDGDALDELRPALRRLEQRYVTTPYVPPRATGVTTSLGDVLDRYAAARAATLHTIAVTGVGCAGVLVTVIALLVALRAHLRRGPSELLRARGASTAQLIAADLLELAPACLVAAAATLGLTAAAGSPSWPAVGAGAAAAGVVAVLLALSGARARSRHVGAAERPTGRRRTVEAVIVVLAVVGVAVARRRGVVTVEGDPLLVAVPTIVAVAVGLLLVRLLPVLAGGLLTFGGDDRSAAVVAALRRVVRRPAPSTLPVVAVTVATATVILTTAATQAVERTLDTAAWFEVGAPAVVDTVDAVPDGSPAFIRQRVSVRGNDRTTVLAVDPATYADLLANTPIATDLAPLRAGGPQLPAITSPTVGAVGTDVTVSLPGVAVVPVEVRATRDRFPGVSPDAPFIVVPLSGLADAVAGDVVANRWYAAGGPLPAGARTQAATAAALGQAPLPAHGLAILRAGAVLAAGLGLAAAAIALVLAARERRRDLVYLRALGMSRRQAIGLTLVETLPPLTAAVVAGVVVGTGLVAALAGGLRLDALTGGVPVTARPDGLLAGIATLALLAPIAAATAVAGWRSLDGDLASALRTEQPW